MGNWNRRRWVPRQKPNYHELPSSPKHHRFESHYRGVQESNVPSWEMDFCFSCGVPWRKVVVTKKYISCHDSVIKWNDSASEEAFGSAKERFWAKINGLPYNTPLPDPDMYIDEIDWNSYIDPKLISDLEKEFFNPDEAGKYDEVEPENQKLLNSGLGNSSGWNHKNSENLYDPWEGTVKLKDAVICRIPWDNSKSKDVENPWEQSHSQADEALKGNGWGGYGNKEWGGNNCKTRNHESRNLENGDNCWKTNIVYHNRDLVHRGWRDGRCRPLGWEQRDNNRWSKDLDSRRQVGGGRAFNDGCRKRECSHQHSVRNKSLRFD